MKKQGSNNLCALDEKGRHARGIKTKVLEKALSLAASQEHGKLRRMTVAQLCEWLASHAGSAPYKTPYSAHYSPPDDGYFVKADPIPDDLCKLLAAESANNMSKLHKKVVEYIGVLHDEWIQHKNVHALLEANYLVDYYCTRIIVACEPPHETYVQNRETKISAAIKKRHKFVWSDIKEPTYDVFKTDMNYQSGLGKLKLLFEQMKKEILSSYDQVTREHILNKRWDRVNVDIFVQIIDAVMDRYKTYYASGLGMYRLINMFNANGDMLDPQKLPCACTCDSLMLCAQLVMLGYPIDHVFVKLQAAKNIYRNRKKPTHWGMACKNIRNSIRVEKRVVPSLLNIDEVVFASSRTFATYTRDVVFYFLLMLHKHRYNVPHQIFKYNTLERFKRLLDAMFLSKVNVDYRTRH